MSEVNRERLTPQRIERFVASRAGANCDASLHDAEVKGLSVRCRASGAASYVVSYRVGGRAGTTRRLTIGPVQDVNLATARKRALGIMAQVHEGKDPFADQKAAAVAAKAVAVAQAAEAARMTLGQLVEAYSADLVRRDIVDARHIESLLRRALVAEFGETQDPRRLTRAELVAVFDRVRDGGELGKATKLANKAHGLLSWAADKGHVDGNVLAGRRNAVSRSERLAQAERSTGRALSINDAAILWSACGDTSVDPRVAAYVRFLLITGCRRTEAAKARLSSISVDTPLGMPVLVLPPELTKNGHAHAVPLPALAMSVLRSFERLHGTDWIFPAGRGKGPLSGWTHRWASVLKVARQRGLTGDVSLHDLRRTARTGWTALGVEEAVAELMLNHRPRNKLLSIYDREQRMPARAAAMQAWTDAIEAAVAALEAGQLRSAA